MEFDVTGSIVLFNNNQEILDATIRSFLKATVRIRLYLVDNSPTDRLKDISSDPRVEYIFIGRNLGFGKGHNVAMKKSSDVSCYHIILNPDVYFEGDVVDSIFRYLEVHHDVGLLAPLILYPGGKIQYSGKLLPTPLDLVARRLFKSMRYFKDKNDVYELVGSGYNKIINAPNQLGCFMFIRTSVLAETGLFDENIFMYLEDIDITRRIHRVAKTIFYPGVSIYHYYEKGSQKKLKLLIYHIRSAIYYFNKWGWFFDAERKKVNDAAVREANTSASAE